MMFTAVSAARRRNAIFAAVLGLSAFISPVHVQAQVPVVVTAEQIEAALATCTDEESCQLALQALIDALVAANPGVPIATIIGSVAAAVIEAYNSGSIPPALAAVLASVSSIASANGLTTLATALTQAAVVAQSGAPVDVQAIAEGSASPT